MTRHRHISRSSIRGRGDSASVDGGDDAREKIKDCCRKVVAFMCTQVGVGGLVVGYALIGAYTFSMVESTYYSNSTTQMVVQLHENYTEKLWRVVSSNNIFNESQFMAETDRELKKFQDRMVYFISKEGYDGIDAQKAWSFSAALMFSLSIITMIGYGNLVPKTEYGKLATVIYAIFGIPLYILYFMNMGKVLAGCFRWVYTRLYECSSKKSDRRATKRVIVPSTACLWVIGAYILTGAIMFNQWEQWDFLDSTYFCVTSLCKLGFGDFVPGAAAKSEDESKLVINFVYILVGLGLVAMCYNLMREEIRVKVQEFKEDFGQCLEDTRVRLLECCSRFRTDDKN